MASRVTKDPTHPDFPHGEERGYFRGCRDACCHEAHLRAGKRRQFLRKQGRPVMAPAAPVRAHVRTLLDAGATRGAILRVAGNPCDLSTLADLLGRANAGSGKRQVSLTLARRLMAVTVEQALAECPYVDKAESVRLVRCLQAQGWTLRYLAQRLTPGGTAHAPDFLADHACATVRMATARAVRALADEIGDRPGPSKRAATTARRLGFYPLIAYDDDGVLHREWLAPDVRGTQSATRRATQAANRETRMANRLRCLSLSLDGKSIVDVADITGVSERTVQRIRDRVGIRFAASGGGTGSIPEPGQEPEVAAARGVLADWAGGDAGVESPVAWKALLGAVAAARAGGTAGCGAADDEAA